MRQSTSKPAVGTALSTKSVRAITAFMMQTFLFSSSSYLGLGVLLLDNPYMFSSAGRDGLDSIRTNKNVVSQL